MTRRPLRLNESIEIDRPASTVWTVIADYGRDIEWRSGLTEMTPDPPGMPRNGTRVREVLRTGGRTYVTDTVVSDVVEGVSYQFTGSGTSGDVAGKRTVTPLGDSRSRFTYEVDLTLRGATRFLKPLVARILGSEFRGNLISLRTLVESQDRS